MYISKCEHCGKEREYQYKSKVKRFCSYTCARRGGKKKTAPKVKITCVCCNKEFEILESAKRSREKASGKEIKFCSKKCFGKNNEKRKEIECVGCGKTFINTRGKFCSKECSFEHRRKTAFYRRRKFYGPIPKSKGYWFENGYKVLYTKNGKGIKEHIKVMEEHIGRKLKPNEVVHHINEIRTDNRIENLQLMTRSEHSSYHRKKELSEGKQLFKAK